ncbi:uncharacterized protein MYCFIDRAFT_179309 [Pseudocercospora fijiensis CIRAD86]|uniref:Uncharacterized protein n=1 Tax=Pseudocercospora fijiensis (strain CIRAD86) TaxID=383855 RepID=M2YJC6_PSEFD|nr:uncharacterized protein MYCFIDRAFT_179309 [Pseudocercospora fijiensis CIRAD86]EME77830.1 hypothetical protein MYCFIDRAFT_179309 [Pseudocercospora fijiensis CIRAD86]
MRFRSSGGNRKFGFCGAGFGGLTWGGDYEMVGWDVVGLESEIGRGKQICSRVRMRVFWANGSMQSVGVRAGVFGAFASQLSLYLFCAI